MSKTMTIITPPRKPKFQKLRIIVEAYRWWKNGDHPNDGNPNIEGKAVRYYRNPDDKGTRLCAHCNLRMHKHGWIDTLEGGHIVCPGDWVITGIEYEICPCKDSVFRSTYEPINEEAKDLWSSDGVVDNAKE